MRGGGLSDLAKIAQEVLGDAFGILQGAVIVKGTGRFSLKKGGGEHYTPK